MVKEYLYLKNIALAFVIFAIYIEITPGLGKIWLRPNSELKIFPSLSLLLKYCYTPFHNKLLWQNEFLDINSVFFIGSLTYMLSIYKNK